MKIHVKDLRSIPDPPPKTDERVSRLLDGAVSGALPVYLAAVPLAICIPFDLDYRPDLHPICKQAIDHTAAAWRGGRPRTLLVYQRGNWFIVFDDYIALFAALQALPDYVPCVILGEPDSDLVKDVQGPIAPEDVLKALGLGSR